MTCPSLSAISLCIEWQEALQQAARRELRLWLWGWRRWVQPEDEVLYLELLDARRRIRQDMQHMAWRLHGIFGLLARVVRTAD